jgi:malonyl-CoA O-methyltransferase
MIPLSKKNDDLTALIPNCQSCVDEEIKKKISKAFDRSSLSYDQVAPIQRLCAEQLVAMTKEFFEKDSSIDRSLPSSILDLGTGTGYVYKLLKNLFPDASYGLNDLSPKMLENCKKNQPSDSKVVFFPGDMEKLIVPKQDLVASNLAFQWTSDLYQTIEKFYTHSRYLMFSCLLENTFAQWNDLIEKLENSHRNIRQDCSKDSSMVDCEKPIDPPHQEYGQSKKVFLPGKKYPSYDRLTVFLENLDPRHWVFQEHTFTLQFSTPKDFMVYLKALGASVSSYQPSWQVLKTLLELKTPLEVTYHVFFALLQRF